MVIRFASARDAAVMLEIYRPYVEHSAVSFETEVPDVAAFAAKIERVGAVYPWLVAVGRVDQGAAERGQQLMGYAYASPHRARGAYRWSCECSVYVAEHVRRRGVARRLYGELFRLLSLLGYANVLAGVARPEDNRASVGLHESMGFELVARYPRVGFKLGRWHDVGWWCLRLPMMDGEPPPPTSLADVRARQPNAQPHELAPGS